MAPIRDLLENKSSVEVKLLISEVSQSVIANPTEQLNKLRLLFNVLEHKDYGPNIMLRKFVIVSLCLVFKDILPTYKISVLTEMQKSQNMKKETFKLYSNEEFLLSLYQKYVKLVESVLTHKFDSPIQHIRWTKEDELTILKCACRLYLNNPQFNFGANLLELLVSFLNSTDEKMLKCATNTVITALKDDLNGDVSLQICTAIKKFIVNTNFKYRSTVLKPLLVMELDDALEDQSDETVNNRKILSRKQKKDFKKDSKKNKKNAEDCAKESLRVKVKNNSFIIRTIFHVYFKTLKQKKVTSKLLHVVLESLEKFSRLIDCRMFKDVFQILTSIVDNPKISMDNRFQSLFVILCITTSGKSSDILGIDNGIYCDKLIALCDNRVLTENSVASMINCMNKLLVKSHDKISSENTMKLMQTVVNMAARLQDSTHLCLSMLVSLVRYLRLHPSSKFALDDDEDGLSDKPNDIIQSLDKLLLGSPMVSATAERVLKFFQSNSSEDSFIRLDFALEECTRLSAKEVIQKLKDLLKSHSLPKRRKIEAK